MTLNPIKGFQHYNTHHCVTGSMQHVYEYNHHPISEEMLLGLGQGIGFIYWHQKGQAPFIGGRGNPKPSMEQITGQRTGVEIKINTSSSPRVAKKVLLEMLENEQPVMLQVDMGFLPYFDFGGADYHFGGHVIVVCGHDSHTNQVLVADRDDLHPVPMEVLEYARGSTYKPFPPKNKWYTFDFSQKRHPTPVEVYRAIEEQSRAMLEPPISNIGVQGIRKTARLLPKWPRLMDEDLLRFALHNAYIFISPVGGTGGGIFRYMFSRFLLEASEVTGDPRLQESAGDFQHIGDRWQELADWFLETAETDNPAELLDECVTPLYEIADLEDVAWGRLLHLAGS